MVTEPRLHGWLLMSLGVLGIVLGGLWTLQGFDIVADSRLSGQSFLTIVGPVVGVAGLLLTVAGVRVRTRSKQQPA